MKSNIPFMTLTTVFSATLVLIGSQALGQDLRNVTHCEGSWYNPEGSADGISVSLGGRVSVEISGSGTIKYLEGDTRRASSVPLTATFESLRGRASSSLNNVVRSVFSQGLKVSGDVGNGAFDIQTLLKLLPTDPQVVDINKSQRIDFFWADPKRPGHFVSVYVEPISSGGNAINLMDLGCS